MLDPAFLSRLEKLALRSRSRAAGARQGGHASRRRGQSLEFADHREYVPGDDIRHLDWHLYARLDALFVKLFEAREDRTVQVVLDRSASMAGSKWEAARHAAAAVSWASLCSLDRVQLFVADRGLRAEGRPARGRGAIHRIFRYLQGTGTAGGTDLLTVSKGLPPARAGAITVLISDLWDPAGVDQSLARLAHRGGELHVLHVVDRRELDPSHLSGDLTLVDSETGAELAVTVDRTMRQDLRAAAEEYFATIDDLCRRRGIGLFRLDAADPVEDRLIDWLRTADELVRRGASSRVGSLRR
ncbi:MAG: DUF58 domain-containing protein [Deltaproteobacteria bacterium]|nr:DUF58 domain-containing protein [Deltaproteobacteria bacterium]